VKYADKLLDVLMQEVERNWNSDKIHVLPHSSGYDSRLMSYIIKTLAEKNGESWLGKMYFICFQPEIQPFLEIMKYEGWSKNHIVTVRPNAPQTDYFAEGMKFENMMKIRYPRRFVCRCFDFVLNKAISNLGNGDVQLISGMWSDEVMEYGSMWKTTKELKHLMKTDVHFDWEDYDTLLPFASDEFINTFIKLKPELPKIHRYEIKKAIIDVLDSGLSALKNYDYEYWKTIRRTGTHPIYKISEETRNEAQKAYDASIYKYRRDIKIVIPDAISNKSEDLIHYMKAAMLEGSWEIIKT
jgi:hypothetical protein